MSERYYSLAEVQQMIAEAREDERGKQRSEWVKDSLPRKYGIDSGWVVSTTDECTCGVGRNSEYGHEAFCGLEQECPVEEFDAWVKHMKATERQACIAAVDEDAVCDCAGEPHDETCLYSLTIAALREVTP